MGIGGTTGAGLDVVSAGGFAGGAAGFLKSFNGISPIGGGFAGVWLSLTGGVGACGWIASSIGLSTVCGSAAAGALGQFEAVGGSCLGIG